MTRTVTDGIQVEVESRHRPDQSQPAYRRWLFTYTVRLTNLGDAPARLVARHWLIRDANGMCQDVEGEGVVGQQPRLEPGEGFEYTSSCVLRAPQGSMEGSYRMVRDDGGAFEARIEPFPLQVPGLMN